MLAPGSKSSQIAGGSTLAAIGISIAVGCALISGLVVSAIIDKVLLLRGGDIGLLQHPGFFAIIAGDAALVLILSITSKSLNSINSDIPNSNSRYSKRALRAAVDSHWNGGSSLFFRILVFSSLAGLMALINQSIKLGSAQHYYGHDTFDSINHTFSYISARIVLFISWCIVIPIYISQAVTYFRFIDTIFKRMHKAGALSFFVEHRDRNGGFAFIGNINILFNVGLLIVIIESIILAYTHRVVSIEIIVSIFTFGLMFVAFSYISTFRILSILGAIEDSMKIENFKKIRSSGAEIDSYHLALNFGVRFSLYTATTERILLSMRAAAFIPTVYKIYVYTSV